LSITRGEWVDKLIGAHLISWSWSRTWLTITCKVIRGNVTPRNFGRKINDDDYLSSQSLRRQ
jgi:hypothetical protein